MSEHLEIIQRVIEARRKFLNTRPDTITERQCWREFKKMRKHISVEARDEYDVACIRDSESQVEDTNEGEQVQDSS
jgi:hypothetical protein